MKIEINFNDNGLTHRINHVKVKNTNDGIMDFLERSHLSHAITTVYSYDAFMYNTTTGAMKTLKNKIYADLLLDLMFSHVEYEVVNIYAEIV